MKRLMFLLLLLVPHTASAQEFHTYHITADIGEDTVDETVEVTFGNLSELTYVLGGNAQAVQVYSEDGPLATSLEEGPPPYLVVSGLEDREHLSINFTTTGPLRTMDGRSEFLLKVRFPLNVTDFSLEAVLPLNTLPSSTRDTYSIFPTPAEEFVREGRYTIVWERSDIVEGNEMIFTAAYSRPERSYLPYILAGVILIIVAGGAVLYYRKREEMLMQGLDQDERKVMGLILEGKVDQQDIQKELGISKVKMTRVVQRLEAKGLVRKEKVGRRNKLYPE